MATLLDLEQIERKAFRATYEDGLWDLYFGAIVAAMALFMFRPDDGYSALNIVGAVLMISLAFSLFTAGKKYITTPRLGQVRFGPQRQQKTRNLALILGVIVFIQVGLVGMSVYGWLNPGVGQWLAERLGGGSGELLLVAALGASFVGVPMLIIAYMNDFLRGLYIALGMALAVFLMIYTNQPIYPLVLAGLIALPGLVLFIRFLQKYPLPSAGGE